MLSIKESTLSSASTWANFLDWWVLVTFLADFFAFLAFLVSFFAFLTALAAFFPCLEEDFLVTLAIIALVFFSCLLRDASAFLTDLSVLTVILATFLACLLMYLVAFLILRLILARCSLSSLSSLRF